MATSPIDWALARRVAVRASGREPFRSPKLRQDLEADFARYTEQAEELVAGCTGLRSMSGAARGRVTDRGGWIDANVASFQRLLRPLIDQIAGKVNKATTAIGSQVAGVEVGVMLGWMSGRVLGQYDLLITEDERPSEQDIVYYVAPNVLALEHRYAFDPQQFRLWLALHEVTHRAQFTGVSWMRPHFLSLVHSTMEGLEPDPKRFAEALRRLMEARRNGEDPLAAGGLMALFASEEQLATMQKLTGLMSLLEGHGDVTMDRAGQGLIPSAARFGRVMQRRRASARGLSKLTQRIVGLDAKLKQYAEGEGFIAAVESAGGQELFDRVWESPDNLPTIGEIREPAGWIARMGVPAQV